MGIFRFGHRHVSQEALTEYLDGRLRAGARERLERVMGGCADCRQEMESLQDTVALLRQLPLATPRRSLVMAGPPVEVVQPRNRSPLHPPQWAYAGAASLAALVLAVLISVDASGLVARVPDAVYLSPGKSVASTDELEDIRRDLAGAEDGGQVETPSQPAGAESIQVERETPVEAPAVAEMQAQASRSAETQAQAPAVAEMQAAAPQTAMTEAQGPQAVDVPAQRLGQEDQASRSTTTEITPPRSEQATDIQQKTVEVLPLPITASDDAPTIATRGQELPPAGSETPGFETPGTPLIWRLLEGAAASVFLVLAGVFFWRRWASRRF